MALCCLEWVNEYYHTPTALNTKAEGSAQRNPRLVIITIENPEETVEKGHDAKKLRKKEILKWWTYTRSSLRNQI